MSKFKIVNLIDKLFVSICTFLVIYAWINFFIRNLYLTFVLSLIFTFAIIFLIYFFINKKQNKKIANKNYLRDVNEKFLAFRLLSKENKILLISKILSLDYKTETKNNTLSFYKNNEKHVVIFATNFEKLDEYNFINLLEQIPNKTDCVDIICNQCLPFNSCVLKNIKINFITKQILYEEFFLKHQIFPDCSNINNETNKFNFKELVKNFFIPQKAKSFFFCGLVLIFSAIILPYHYYYLIFGTLFLICSIICKLKAHFTL